MKTVVNFEISIQLLNLHTNVVTAVKCQIIGAEIEIYERLPYNSGNLSGFWNVLLTF